MKNIGYAVVVAATAAAFVFGSVGASEAKAKKKAAAAPAPVVSVFCILPYAPVCAVKGGQKFTYANACYAANDGAKVASNEACPAKKAVKAKKGGKKMGKKAGKKPTKKK